MFSHLEWELRMKANSSVPYTDLPLTGLYILIIFVIRSSVFVHVPFSPSECFLLAHLPVAVTSGFSATPVPPLIVVWQLHFFSFFKKIKKILTGAVWMPFVCVLGAKLNLGLMLNGMFLRGHFTRRVCLNLSNINHPTFHHFLFFAFSYDQPLDALP